MAEYFEKLKKYMNSDPSKDNYLDKAAKGVLGFIEDKPAAPGDDSLREPLLSPIDIVPYAEMGSLAAKGLTAGAKALAAPAERILANEIGSIGRNVIPNVSATSPKVAERLASMPMRGAPSSELVNLSEEAARKYGTGSLATASTPQAQLAQQRLNTLRDMLARRSKKK
jgi:hypothetical protein